MLRFVILTHNYPFPHWDFMLEQGDSLRTWRLRLAPDTGRQIIAEPLADHRRHYLDYEGPLSGGRGEVRRWDHGDYEPIEMQTSRVEVRLAGTKLDGRAILEQTDDSTEWTFYFSPE